MWPLVAVLRDTLPIELCLLQVFVSNLSLILLFVIRLSISNLSNTMARVALFEAVRRLLCGYYSMSLKPLDALAN